jgi:hypothetical protein
MNLGGGEENSSRPPIGGSDRSALPDFGLSPFPLLHGYLLFGSPQTCVSIQPKAELQTTVVFFRAHDAADSARARLEHARRIGESTSLQVIARLRLPVALLGPHRQNVMMPLRETSRIAQIKLPAID